MDIMLPIHPIRAVCSFPQIWDQVCVSWIMSVQEGRGYEMTNDTNRGYQFH